MSLVVENGSFAYPHRPPTLEDVSFTVPRGQMLAVLGPNGVGKTTLLRCMLGLQRWSTGRTLLDGVDIASLRGADRWRRIGFVPQARNASALSLTGLDMVTIGRASHLGMFAQPRRADRELAEHVMSGIGIGHLRHTVCGEMSGGQFQMILIARALAGEPEVLVLDEPETGLDFRNQLIVLDLLDRLVHEQALVAVMNTHYPTHALRVADQVLLLSREAEPVSGPTDETLTAARLGRAFGVRVEVLDHEVDGTRHRSVLAVELE